MNFRGSRTETAKGLVFFFCVGVASFGQRPFACRGVCLKCRVGLLDSRGFGGSSATKNHRNDGNRSVEMSPHMIDAVDGHTDER